MPSYELSVPHELTKEDARERIAGFAEKLKEMMGDKLSDLEHGWEGDTMKFGFSVMGMKITGELTPTDDSVDVRGNLPLAAAMFKGKIVGDFEQQLTKILR